MFNNNSFSLANNGAKREQKKQNYLKNYIVPVPKLHYKCADCEEALGHSSNNQRYFGNPDIFGPQQDICVCQGGGCPRCW